jgi:uncharacterized membrane protein
MDSPAGRLERLLIGVILPLIFLISIVFIDNELTIKECSYGTCNNYIILLLLILLVIIFIIILLINRFTYVLDQWFSKENDEKMRLRLEEEYREADISNLNSQWAKMEMEHLENKHGEE